MVTPLPEPVPLPIDTDRRPLGASELERDADAAGIDADEAVTQRRPDREQPGEVASPALLPPD
ncbi:hypothetical protein EYB45_10080 [Erythrobacteraceae bacterium CFH 75059]|uniref:hypothetical protein n=1 Tax=Qipengyuania thermophila TaxID=2509361 RepID=UPI0010220FAB|nr:hypothetical protein [Qipengyuania thermophila]TCD02025.1 hypothetical protein EYB45_10080 [Erythrobacteraceae bacterium CFH 75059]